MSKLSSLKADIENDVCTLIQTYNRGLGYVVMYNGLLMYVEFDKDGDTVMDFEVKDKEHDTEYFLDHYQHKYDFSHVMVTGHVTVHFIYVKPLDMRPWMVKTINATEDNLVWCIHRQFESNINNLDNFFKGISDFADVSFYTRELESDQYTKVSRYKLYSTAPAFEETNFFESSTAKS